MRRLQLDLLALAGMAGLVFLALAVVSWSPADAAAGLVVPEPTQPVNWCGPAGATAASVLIGGFGWAAWALLGGLAVMDWRLLARRTVSDPILRLAGLACQTAAVCVLLHQFLPDLPRVHVVGSGGYVGAVGSLVLTRHFSMAGSLVIVATLLLIGGVLAAEHSLLRGGLRVLAAAGAVVAWPMKRFGRWLQKKPKPRPVVDASADEISEDDGSPTAAHSGGDSEPADELDDAPAENDAPESVAFKVNAPAHTVARTNSFEGLVASGRDYELPSLDVLDDAEEFPFEELAAKAQVAAKVLEKTFKQFGLNVTVSEIDTGPVVTQFELDLEPGLRVSKVSALADDLAIALRVPSVRVVSPIPGKNTVGVEVPNKKRVNVRMRELIEGFGEDAAKMALPLFLGKDVSGKPLCVDLAKMPHLLIAGRTGTGKSVCLNTLITSLLMTRGPDEVRMLMIDPKMVELSPYKYIPHLMHPVITDMKKAEAVLAWAVDKMEERYDLLARVGVRQLKNYNELGYEEVLDRLGLTRDDEEADEVPEKMPSIVIVADEMADLMMTCGKEVETHLARLAGKARAVGIHLVLATQKPTVDVITGLIKSNLPSRIAFQVASKTDSRVVLDEGGADRLLGNGDMLYLASGTSCLTRAQGTFVSDDELEDVLEHFGHTEPEYSEEIKAVTAGAGGNGKGLAGMNDRDELYRQAVEVVIREQKGSVSLIQRALGVGYGRSARMVDYMHEDGIVGEANGAKPREVLFTMDDWEEFADSGALG